jgi:hypothetical protein
MLHYRGDELALDLGNAARFYLQLYAKKGELLCKIPFKDLERNGKVRFVKFEWLEGVNDWVFVDLMD